MLDRHCGLPKGIVKAKEYLVSFAGVTLGDPRELVSLHADALALRKLNCGGESVSPFASTIRQPPLHQEQEELSAAINAEGVCPCRILCGVPTLGERLVLSGWSSPSLQEPIFCNQDHSFWATCRVSRLVPVVAAGCLCAALQHCEELSFRNCQ